MYQACVRAFARGFKPKRGRFRDRHHHEASGGGMLHFRTVFGPLLAIFILSQPTGAKPLIFLTKLYQFGKVAWEGTTVLSRT
jgi:hypothetical protein